MSQLEELTKKYGEGVPVGLFVGQKEANQTLNKFYYDIAMGNLTPEQHLSALEFLEKRIEED
jgi:hypothetical protein